MSFEPPAKLWVWFDRFDRPASVTDSATVAYQWDTEKFSGHVVAYAPIRNESKGEKDESRDP
jgi:hypothetical protein